MFEVLGVKSIQDFLFLDRTSGRLPKSLISSPKSVIFVKILIIRQIRIKKIQEFVASVQLKRYFSDRNNL